MMPNLLRLMLKFFIKVQKKIIEMFQMVLLILIVFRSIIIVKENQQKLEIIGIT